MRVKDNLAVIFPGIGLGICVVKLLEPKIREYGFWLGLWHAFYPTFFASCIVAIIIISPFYIYFLYEQGEDQDMDRNDPG